MATTVVLDPGHGQYTNPYPAAPGYYEGTQMYKLGVMIKSKLEASGIKVIMTRKVITDDPALTVRGKTAGTNKADLFISLHSDAIGSYISESARGVSVYYSIQDAAENKKFATSLSANVSSLMNTRNRGALTRIGNGNLDYYGVIRNSAASGCKRAFLIEHGFHTNPTDVKWLIDDSKLSQIADIDARTICTYFGVSYKGSSTGNSADVSDSKEETSTEKYSVYTEIPKYTSAANAMSGDKSLSVGTLAVGDYYIYKTYNGSYNLTKTAGVAGAWINPADNVKASAPSTADKIETTTTYELYREVKKYSTAADAISMTNNVGTAEPGRYYVYNTSGDMINLTTKQGTPGFWMNPAQNLYTSFYGIDADGKGVKFEKDDIVMFRTGFTPKYGGGGTAVPLTIIAEVNGKKNATISDFRTYNGNEYEVKLSTINAWVGIKYLYVYKKAEKTVEETPKTDKPTEDTTEKVTSVHDCVLKDEKYSGIVEAIKSGLLQEFLQAVVEEITEDDSVNDQDSSFEFISGNSVATKKQMIDYVKKHNPDFDESIAEAFLTVSKKYGIRGDVAFCQSILETGWFLYTGGTAVKPEQHNYAGIGVTSLGVPGASFATVAICVEAQLQHLYAYATKEDLPEGRTLYDPRWYYVTRGCAPRWIDLNGKWSAGADYGEKILQLWNDMIK